MNEPLYPFQEEGISFALAREGALIADEMGLGKTCQAIGVINEDSSIRRSSSFVRQHESCGAGNLSDGSNGR